MDKFQALIVAALADLWEAGVVSAADEAGAEQEKCCGLARTGQNDCASSGCAGQSKVDNDAIQWEFVVKGTCTSLGGPLAPQVNEALR